MSNLKVRLARLESGVGGRTPQRARLAGLCTLIARAEDPHAPAVRAADLPPEWTCYGDLVAASYVLDDVEPQSASPPAGP